MSTIKVSQISPLGTDSTKTITIGSFSNGDTIAGPGSNKPMVKARRTSTQSISNNTWTKVIWNTADVNEGSAYDTSTGTFTVPANYGGKYQIYGLVNAGGTPDDGERVDISIYKNGSQDAYTVVQTFSPTGDTPVTAQVNTILDLAAGDYIEMYMRHNEGGTQNLEAERNGFFITRMIG